LGIGHGSGRLGRKLREMSVVGDVVADRASRLKTVVWAMD
jgi:hypothetical protein